MEITNIDYIEKAEPVCQRIDSAKTSLLQVPALFKNKNAVFMNGGVNIDIGGGKYNLSSQYLNNVYSVRNIIFDPYNRSFKENLNAVMWIACGNKSDTVTCANVLNVIKEKESRENVLSQCAMSVKPGGAVYFSMYNGSGDSIGKQTTKGWQENRKTKSYLDEINMFFGNAVVKGEIIIAKYPKPVANNPIWELEKGFGVKISNSNVVAV